jgi:hypothetical protein
MKDFARRRFLLGGLVGAGAVVTVGGGVTWIVDAREAGAYEAAVADTWRHSDSFDPPLPTAQRELVRYATLAANSHNTQPWRFRLSDRSISVTPDLERGLATVDPDNHHLFATLGCATENLVQAAAAFGLRATASFDAAAGGISVDLEKSPPVRSPLFEAIPRRQSTRSVFDGRAVPAEHLRLLEAAGNGNGVQLQLFTEASNSRTFSAISSPATALRWTMRRTSPSWRRGCGSTTRRRSQRTTDCSRNAPATRPYRVGWAV